MKFMYKLLIIATCCLSVQAFAIEKLSVSELLDRYAANQDKLKSFIVKTETISTYLKRDASTQEERKRRYIEDFRYKDSDSDLIAYYSLKEFNLGEDGIWVPRESQRTFLWESKRYYQYHRAPVLDSSSVKIITSDENYTNPIRGITILYTGAEPMLGLLFGDVERFDSIFKQTDTISVRNELERVGSVDCYVIDAKSEHGTYTVWLDPEHGYGIAKAELHKGPEDLIHGRPPSSYRDMESYKGKSSFIENVRFKNIEGIWISVEADIRAVKNRQDSTSSWYHHYKITQIDVNPNHAELQSFVLNVQNGTRIRIIDEPRFEYIWDDGKKFVEDDWDGSIRYVPKDWSVEVGIRKQLPKFEGIKLKLSAEQTKNRAILLCFFDMNQRPSRNCVRQLSQKAAALKEKGVTIEAIQTSKVTEKNLSEWKKRYNISFPVGMITADIEKTRFAWGVRSLPWLILTDKQHVVTAEGFNPAELDIEKLSVSELLDRYAANQDQLISFIAKTEEVHRVQWSNKERPDFSRKTTEVRVDSKKTHMFYRVWRDLPTLDAPTPIEEARNWVDLWDGKRSILYYYRISQDYKFAEISTDEIRAKANINIWHKGTPFLGIRYSDYEQRIDSVLRQADTISVRKELEQVGSVACYVIDANTTSGTYTVWFDPQHGYQIARAEIRLGPNDRYRNRPLKDNEDDSLSVRNIRFENIDGVWIAMEADKYATSIRQGSSRVRSTGHHKITQITLNPDHEALGSFIPVVENGTEVYDIDAGVSYTWRDGMKFVVDEWDGSIRYVPKEWSILVGVGKPLPQLEGIKLNLSDEQTKDKAILLCFFDMNQRPSRYCIKQLAQKAAGLKEKGIIVAAVQTSQVTEKTLNEWTKKRNTPFPVGAITADIEKTRFAWGVRSLPWLILTDKQHVVTAEGFTLDELNEKLGNNPKHKSGPTR